jgi:hypothetical protein
MGEAFSVHSLLIYPSKSPANKTGLKPVQTHDGSCKQAAARVDKAPFGGGIDTKLHLNFQISAKH